MTEFDGQTRHLKIERLHKDVVRLLMIEDGEETGRINVNTMSRVILVDVSRNDEAATGSVEVRVR